jgi:hypothetical protein
MSPASISWTTPTAYISWTSDAISFKQFNPIGLIVDVPSGLNLLWLGEIIMFVREGDNHG